VDTFNNPPLFQLVLRHAADAIRCKVGVSSLDATKAAEVFITLLLPLGNQVWVGYFLLDTVIIEVPGDCLAPIVEVKEVP